MSFPEDFPMKQIEGNVMKHVIRKPFPLLILALALLIGCKPKATEQTQERKYSLERVGPARVVQVYADGFEQLPLKQKIFAYYLSLAALAGRDISIDQHHRNALEVRNLFEGIITHPAGIDTSVLRKITTYAKLFWINNGFYDNITAHKLVPECTFEEFKAAAEVAQKNGADLELKAGETLSAKVENLRKVMFDETFEPMMTDKTPGHDWVKESGVNFYGPGLTTKEVEDWAKAGREKHPLNSKIVKENGRLVEEVWRAGGDGAPRGIYAADLSAVIKYLEMAKPYTSGDYQRETLDKLIKYFRTGSLEDFRQFNIQWVKDTSAVDFINGFIEVYIDPRGQKAEFESSVFWADQKLTKTIRDIGDNAQYFEDKMPWNAKYKKRDIKALSANFVNVVVETGETGPVSPIGINLPNEQAVREQYGSKSVVLGNVIDAGNRSGGRVLLDEFAYDETEKQLAEKYGTLEDNMLTTMHEVLGHASGRVSVSGDPADYLPGYYSTLEEGRADLVALWHIWDDKLIELGAMPNKDVARAMYNTYVLNALLLQLRRIPNGDQLEEDHMKNRQMIGKYILENSNAIKMDKRNGKTYVKVVDYERMHETVGRLLAEVMRIKAEGDLAGAKKVIDMYGLKINTTLRDEVRERIKHLDVASYIGYVMPKLDLVKDSAGEITGVQVSYPVDLTKQMLEYSAFTQNERRMMMEKQGM
jgi:dipeptidyl-peptidase-3